MTRRRGPTPARRWEPLTQRTGLEGLDDPTAYFARYGVEPPDEIWGSALYTCIVRYALVDGVRQRRSDLLWLSIHRRDRKPLRDWRHMQAIKNDVAGHDRVAVEVYPAEDDLVDTSNEYHLWVLPAGFDLPFGFGKGGLLMDADEVAAKTAADGVGRAVQRAWEPGITTGPTASRDAGDAKRARQGATDA